MTWYDSMWFAYISTTTIGFGDFVLSPDVFLAEDIFLWPFSFLVGFVFFAAFIEKMRETFVSPLHNIVTALAQRLKVEHPTESDSLVEGEPSGELQNNMGESGNDGSPYDKSLREVSSEPSKDLEDELVPHSSNEPNPEGHDENVSSLVDPGAGSQSTTTHSVKM